MLSQGNTSSNNRLLTLLNGVRNRDYDHGVPVEKLIDVDKSHNRFEKVWLPLICILFLLVAVAGTNFWPSILAMRIFEYLFILSIHIYFLFKIFRSMIPGEFEKPIHHSLLLAVPIASAINVGTRMIVTNWSLSTPTYFGHVSCTATQDWLRPIIYENNWLPLNIGFFGAVILMFVVIWLHSKVRFRNLLIPFLFYSGVITVVVIAINIALAVLSRMTTDAMVWIY